eukprot:sb/3463809/
MFQLREHYTKLLTLCKQRQERLAEMVTFQTGKKHRWAQRLPDQHSSRVPVPPRNRLICDEAHTRQQHWSLHCIRLTYWPTFVLFISIQSCSSTNYLSLCLSLSLSVSLSLSLSLSFSLSLSRSLSLSPSLSPSFLYLSDTDEILQWLNDMEKIIENENEGRDEAAAQLLLKKHKALEEEIVGYKTMIADLRRQQDNLSSEDRLLSITRERQDLIEGKYKKIYENTKLRKERLVFAFSMFLLTREADREKSWILEKEALLETIKTPEEYTDDDVAERRFESFLDEMEVNEDRKTEVIGLGEQLIEKSHPKSEEIEAIINEIAELWDKLQSNVDAKREELKSTRMLQQLKNELQSSLNWINCKAKALMAIESKEIPNIETKMRTVDLIGNELELVQDTVSLILLSKKVGKLSTKADELPHLAREEREEIRNNKGKVLTQWEELHNLLEEKKKQLIETAKFAEYLNELDSFMLWENETLNKVESRELDVGIARVDLKVKTHNDIKSEIESFESKYKTLLTTGRSVCLFF